LYYLDHRLTLTIDPAGQVSQKTYNLVGDWIVTQEGDRPGTTMNYDLLRTRP
jgi:hypothetical protein